MEGLSRVLSLSLFLSLWIYSDIYDENMARYAREASR